MNLREPEAGVPNLTPLANPPGGYPGGLTLGTTTRTEGAPRIVAKEVGIALKLHGRGNKARQQEEGRIEIRNGL